VRLRRNCHYVAHVRLRSRAPLGSGRLRFLARFSGNRLLTARSARVKRARAG
jgi:hypothetical protein